MKKWLQSLFSHSVDEIPKDKKPVVHEQHPIFSCFNSWFTPPFNDEYFEWIDLLEAVQNAKDQFVMIELGAGNGRWGGNGGAAAKVRGIPYKLLLIEAEPSRTEVGIHEQMKKINISRESYQIIKAAVGADNKTTFFYVNKGSEQTSENWFGQSIVLDQDYVVQPLETTYFGEPLHLTKYGYTAFQIQQRKFSDILNSIDNRIIDLCDFDIQGKEFEVINESIDLLNQRVKRLHVATHNHEVEHALRTLLTNHNWRLIRDYPCDQENETPYGKMVFQDGIQTWINERF